MKRNKHIVVPSDGTSCELCGEVAEVREHPTLTDKMLRQPFYYSRWYCCKNPMCKRTLFMLDEYRVLNKNAAARRFKSRQQEIADFTMPRFDF